MNSDSEHEQARSEDAVPPNPQASTQVTTPARNTTLRDVAIALISAATSVVVAWITAGGVAQGKTDQAIQQSRGTIAQIAGASRELPVGTIIASLLEPGEFARQVNDPAVFDPEKSYWILADGQKDVTRSKYESATRKNRVPDLRGLFLRGINQARKDGKEDPDGERESGAVQEESLGSHDHPLSQEIGRSNGWAGGWGGVSDQKAVNGPGDGAMKVLTFGGKETRPRNAAVFYYIRIN